MPAGASLPPRAVPGRLAGLRPLPQGEVGRVALELPRLHPRTRLELLQHAAGELAVAGQGGDVEVHIAFRVVGVAALDKRPDHRHHLGDMLCRTRLDVRGEDVQRFTRPVVLLTVAVRDLLRRDTLGLRAGDDLVLDIGDVLDVRDPEATELEVAT